MVDELAAMLRELANPSVNRGAAFRSSSGAPSGGPLQPEDERSTFRFADTNLAAALVAAEPAIVSPVAVAWDEAGHLFVAEMNDYPLGPGGGQIRMLRDRDRDGRYEEATVFADRLPFPTSVLPWNKGVLVTAAPNIWFLKDTDGDGKADERRVLFTGFGEGNQQLRVNGLFWGLDNWVYGANGRSDGDVRRPDEPPERAVSMRGHDFRFQPGEGVIEILAGRSQFGTAHDDFGHRFLSWNTIPVRQVVIEQSYPGHSPNSALTESIQDLSPASDDKQVFPLTRRRSSLTRNPQATSMPWPASPSTAATSWDAIPPAARIAATSLWENPSGTWCIVEF